MFVRAPKHFKAGKQHVFYFRGNFCLTQTKITDDALAVLNPKSEVVFNFFEQHARLAPDPDTNLLKIVVKAQATISFINGWSYFFRNFS